MRTDNSNVKRLAPPYKDWNEVLKAKNGAPALPAVPNKHKEEYHRQVENLQYLKCRPDKLTSQIYAAFKNEQYKYLAEYALAGSAFLLIKAVKRICLQSSDPSSKQSTSRTQIKAKQPLSKEICRNVLRQ